MNQPVFWLTGLPGAGKTTLATALVQKFNQANIAVVHLDGDQLRQVFQSQDYSRDGRLALAMQYARLSLLLQQQQIPVIVSTVSLFHQVQQWNRANITGYTEVFLATPLAVLQQRDQKNLYSIQDETAIAHTVSRGITAEFPQQPDFIFELSQYNELEPSAELLWQYYLSKKDS